METQRWLCCPIATAQALTLNDVNLRKTAALHWCTVVGTGDWLSIFIYDNGCYQLAQTAVQIVAIAVSSYRLAYLSNTHHLHL